MWPFKRVFYAVKGQVLAELVLILPVFLFILFCIMELGNIAYYHLLVNHAAYELARVGSLTAGPPVGSIDLARSKMEAMAEKMFHGAAELKVGAEGTSNDPQSPVSRMNMDMLVTVKYRGRLIFPGASYILATPRGSGVRVIVASVRMPIENPPV
ncbi:MAG: pilus assembly protein [Elusimicrobia bacterium]|nr:pilus assembly protein [Elusimicrobiota bacterium]